MAHHQNEPRIEDMRIFYFYGYQCLQHHIEFLSEILMTITLASFVSNFQCQTLSYLSSIQMKISEVVSFNV